MIQRCMLSYSLVQTRYQKQKMDQMSTFRRETIIGFPNRFEDGNGAHKDLFRKLSTEDELSGIFNILIIALRTLLRNGIIFVHEKTI